jgi:flagellar export protein FliJ
VKPFCFRLEKILRYRAHLEKRVRLQFCEAVNKVKDQETRIGRLSHRRMGAAERMGGERERPEGIPVYRDHIHTSFVRGLEERMAEEGRELEKSRERMERVRTLLSVAAMKKRSLQFLKEVQVARFKTEQERMDQKFLDDLIVMTRKRGEK